MIAKILLIMVLAAIFYVFCSIVIFFLRQWLRIRRGAENVETEPKEEISGPRCSKAMIDDTGSILHLSNHRCCRCTKYRKHSLHKNEHDQVWG